MPETTIDNKISKIAAASKKETARLSYLRVTPRKVRAVAGLLKGLSVNEAEAQLLSQSRRPARHILKLLRSAVAGAVKNSRLNPEKLYIESVRVDQGPMLKRSLPRAKGMATPIQKKMSHVTLVLAENPALKEPRFKFEAKKKSKKKIQESAKKEKKAPSEKKETEQPAQRQQQQSGFFKRVFRRKSI